MNPHFPKRVYTTTEVEKARKLVESGYKHKLEAVGSSKFKEQAEKAIQHVKTAGYYDFLRAYIRTIREIDGFSQLRETEAAVWANTQLLSEPVKAAGFIVQKAWQMKEFLEGELYYGGAAEARSVEKRLEFLRALKNRTDDSKLRNECEKLLQMWAESTFL